MAAAAPSAAAAAESREARPQPDPVQAYTSRLAPRLETSRVELNRLRTQITRVKSNPTTMRDLTWLAQTTTAIGKLRTAGEELQRRGTAPEALQGLDTLAAALGTELLAIADEARAQVGTGRVAELVQLTARLDASTALSQQGSTELAELR